MPNAEPDYKVISILGDSIANGYFDDAHLGWATRLVQKLQQEKLYGFYLRNFAVSGDRASNCLERYRSSAASNPDEALIIACGINDLARWGTRDSATSLSPSFSKEIWASLLFEAKRDFKHVYVLQILPVDESKVPARQSDDGEELFYRNDYIDAYNVALKTLCQSASCPFIDFTTMLRDVCWDEYLFDDVHPNKKGHALMAQTVFD